MMIGNKDALSNNHQRDHSSSTDTTMTTMMEEKEDMMMCITPPNENTKEAPAVANIDGAPHYYLHHQDITTITMDADDTLLHVLLQQEATGYDCVRDYMSEEEEATPPLSASASVAASSSSLSPPIDAACRHLMASWCYSIADLCQYSRETVASALNCVDRFVSTPQGRKVCWSDRQQYQLVVMTCLYNSVKIHEQQVMPPSLMASLSRGHHTIKAIEAMELQILVVLKWRVNPPTAMAFVRVVLEGVLLQGKKHNQHRHDTIRAIAQQHIEATVLDYHFATTYPTSAIACAAIVNALEQYTTETINTMMVVVNRDNIVIRDILNEKDELVAMIMTMFYSKNNNNSANTPTHHIQQLQQEILEHVQQQNNNKNDNDDDVVMIRINNNTTMEQPQQQQQQKEQECRTASSSSSTAAAMTKVKNKNGNEIIIIDANTTSIMKSTSPRTIIASHAA